MSSKLIFQILAFIKYQRNARNSYSIHSPYIFEFYNSVIKSKPDNNSRKVESIRKKLEKDTRILTIEDMGAGMRGNSKDHKLRPIPQIAKRSARDFYTGKILQKICEWWKPKQSLELGTNLGISALYQLMGYPSTQLVTIEGSEAIAKIAQENFASEGFTPIQIVGNFNAVLPQIKWSEFTPDLIFIDGNHRKVPTIEYFYFLIERCAPVSIFIFDDIHWSAEMESAWDIIRKDNRVNVSIDLLHFGICFIGREQAKEHFILRNT